MRLLSMLALLLACLVAGCAQAEPPRPLLWKVSDADNHLYLLGSFHLLKEGDYPLAPSTGQAFEDAEQVLFEIAPAELRGPELPLAMAKAARRSDGRRLQDSLDPALWARLEAWAARTGTPLEPLQGMDAWFVALSVSLTEMQRLGLNPQLGLDRHFAERAVSAGKAVEGLETGAEQIAIFEEMDPRTQQQSLEDALGDAAEMKANINRMHALWRAGDAEGLHAETSQRLAQDYPALYARVNRERNQAWLPRLQRQLDEGGANDDALVVVGALHLLGEDGLVALLREAGYTVERL